MRTAFLLSICLVTGCELDYGRPAEDGGIPTEDGGIADAGEPSADAGETVVTGSVNWGPELAEARLMPAVVDVEGSALIAGGLRQAYSDPTASTELFTGGTASPGQDMPSLTNWFPLAVNVGQGRVLLPCGGPIKRYDFATRSWTGGDSIPGNCLGAATAVLRDGRVLVAGGSTTPPSAQAFIVDPETLAYVEVPPMPTGRYYPAAATLHDGRVLVIGGYGANDQLTAAVEAFDPSTNTWTQLPPLTRARDSLTATTLPNGEVVVIGGLAGPNAASALVEVFDLASSQWRPGPSLKTARFGHTATLLSNGDVIVVGGQGRDYRPVGLVERVSCARNVTENAGRLGFARFFHGAAAFGQDEILVVGGMQHFEAGPTKKTEIWSSK